MKLTMICDTEISQFKVTVAGLYAWRNKDLPTDKKDSNWNFGVLKVGEEITGQYEGTGPIQWKTTS